MEQRTDPTWPTMWFAPRVTGFGAFSDVYSVMANWGANHGAFSYGHIGADLISLASMLRIPVSMHNVEDAEVYRPTAWAAFGTKDLEYRCRSLDFALHFCKNRRPVRFVTDGCSLALLQSDLVSLRNSDRYIHYTSRAVL